MRSRTLVGLSVCTAIAFVSPVAEGQVGSTVSDWPAPSRGAGAIPGWMRTMGDVTGPLPFIGVTPCRIVDTRGPAGPFGSPSLAAGVPRDFALAGGPCSGI